MKGGLKGGGMGLMWVEWTVVERGGVMGGLRVEGRVGWLEYL